MPDRPGWQRRLHQGAAWLMAVLFLPLAAFIVAAPDLVFRVRFVAAAIGLYMLGTFIWGVVLRGGRQHFLAFQVIYIIAFRVLILAAAYLS
ncbi:MAG TPA: hypothetical protein VLI05_00940 [Candidatus Saccharimonadia bacterium]|nr:hypothetical protein [Candidatus Saccharimonadia bacterium]